jgi:hypothetical protein
VCLLEVVAMQGSARYAVMTGQQEICQWSVINAALCHRSVMTNDY